MDITQNLSFIYGMLRESTIIIASLGFLNKIFLMKFFYVLNNSRYSSTEYL